MQMIIGQYEKERLRRIVKYAEEHPFTIDDFLDLMNDPSLAAGLNPNFKCFIPQAFKVVYTIEEIPAGKIRHLSISINEKNKVVNPAGMQMIMDIIGFNNPLDKCHVHEENLEPNYCAMNVMELI